MAASVAFGMYFRKIEKVEKRIKIIFRVPFPDEIDVSACHDDRA